MFFDDTQLEVTGKCFEGADFNYNGQLALSWQTLWVGPLLADSHIGSPGDVSDQLLPMLERNRALWKDKPAHFYADSPTARAALRTSPLRHQRPKEFQTLFGYLLGNRQGIDAWWQIPAALRRGRGRTPPQLKPGSGAVEKNIEIAINRRFKRQGRSWNPCRAERLLQLNPKN